MWYNEKLCIHHFYNIQDSLVKMISYTFGDFVMLFK